MLFVDRKACSLRCVSQLVARWLLSCVFEDTKLIRSQNGTGNGTKSFPQTKLCLKSIVPTDTIKEFSHTRNVAHLLCLVKLFSPFVMSQLKMLCILWRFFASNINSFWVFSFDVKHLVIQYDAGIIIRLLPSG